MIGGLDLGHVRMAGMESARGHHHHRHVDEAGDRQRDKDFPIRDTHHGVFLIVIMGRYARLGQAGMQVDRVRHHRRTDNADRQQQRLGIGDFRHDRMISRRAPIHRRNEDLDQIAKPDNADQAADDQFDRPEAAALEQEDAIGDDRGDAHAVDQRHLEQQRQADRAAEKFGEIGGHGGDLAHHPHGHDHRFGKMVAAHFREVAPGDNAELGGERLEQHGDQVGDQHDPQQAVTVFGAGLDVGGEIARVHVGDGSDDRGAGESEIGRRAAPLAAQNGLRRHNGAVGQGPTTRIQSAHAIRLL